MRLQRRNADSGVAFRTGGVEVEEMRRRWHLIPPRDTSDRLRAELGVSPLLARLLVNRGVVEAEQAAVYLGPRLSHHLRSPMLFRDMAAATERIVRALQRAEPIGIYGDYDVDGISGSAILVRFFRSLGSEPLLYIPHRLRDGYGLTEKGVRVLAERGARVMITVDCGGVNHHEIAVARALGMDVVVCDHHQVADTPLNACAVLNPIEKTAGFPFSGLCGAGVAFYLALGIRMRLRESGASQLPDLRRSLDLVALGTIADLVPLVEENRVLVTHGLRELSRSESPGVKALKAVSGVGDVSTGVVGFRLAPRLNAGGRLADATRSVELLTTDDGARADVLATGLDEENKARQGIEREILDEAIAMVEAGGGVAGRRSIVLGSSDWHPGVIGIVASRLVERYYRPTILIAVDDALGVGRGSARSIRGFNVYEAIKACQGCLVGFGGHRMAAGLSIRAERLGELVAGFETAVSQATTADDFIPVSDADAELPFTAIDERTLSDIASLEPYGQGNPEPVFIVRGARVAGSRIVGETHLKLYAEHGGRTLPCIGFGMADAGVQVGSFVDLLFSPMWSEWGGTRSIELRLRDFREAIGSAPALSAEVTDKL